MLVEKVCAYFEIAPIELSRKGLQNALSRAKNLICYWELREFVLSLTEHVNLFRNLPTGYIYGELAGCRICSMAWYKLGGFAG